MQVPRRMDPEEIFSNMMKDNMFRSAVLEHLAYEIFLQVPEKRNEERFARPVVSSPMLAVLKFDR